ncbi:DUF4433 domain-containing protein [Pseudomonas protegens]|uniref:DUF4433 domain-containing protein n=1 Tax=Pseudomonas protegens TaxID=380021 RepID=UPI002155AEE6
MPFVFANARAYSYWTDYYRDLMNLSQVDWAVLQRRDFKRDPDDLKKAGKPAPTRAGVNR